MLSSICQCDKSLEPLSTCLTYSNSFYPMQLFLIFICNQTFPFTNILHPYLLNNQLIFPQSFSLPLSLSRFFSPRPSLSHLILSLFLFLSTSLPLPLSVSHSPSLSFLNKALLQLCMILFFIELQFTS